MSWFFLTLLSALFLGFYDVAKKMALKGNAVRPVLFSSVLVSGVVWLPMILWSNSHSFPTSMAWLQVEPLRLEQHFLLFLKSSLVAASWGFAYVALKHLPMTIASTIRATSPLWTIVIATLFLEERPRAIQWLGVSIILSSFYAFSFVGKREGIHFHRDRWVGCMVAATLLAACSALYDKFLLQRCGFSPATVQAWFSIYLVVVVLPFFLHWRFSARSKTIDQFEWRWVILWIGVSLLIADFLYFAAIQKPDALISLISPLRRSSVLVPFVMGIWWFGEKSFRPKAVCIGAMLIGIFLLSLAK